MCKFVIIKVRNDEALALKNLIKGIFPSNSQLVQKYSTFREFEMNLFENKEILA